MEIIFYIGISLSSLGMGNPNMCNSSLEKSKSCLAWFHYSGGLKIKLGYHFHLLAHLDMKSGCASGCHTECDTVPC